MRKFLLFAIYQLVFYWSRYVPTYVIFETQVKFYNQAKTKIKNRIRKTYLPFIYLLPTMMGLWKMNIKVNEVFHQWKNQWDYGNTRNIRYNWTPHHNRFKYRKYHLLNNRQ